MASDVLIQAPQNVSAATATIADGSPAIGGEVRRGNGTEQDQARQEVDQVAIGHESDCERGPGGDDGAREEAEQTGTWRRRMAITAPMTAMTTSNVAEAVSELAGVLLSSG